MNAAARPGPLALVGGDEFRPGNEPHDERLMAAARTLGDDRPAFIIATAAVRSGDPDAAVATARRWFAELGLDVVELRLRTRTEANAASTVDLARTGRFFYVCGGDPGLVVRTLQGTAAWSAVVEAWRGGAPLAGSSAGAMALGAWTLLRARVPGDAERAPSAALDVVPRVAVLPHYETFGHRWLPSARRALDAEQATLLGIDERSAALWHGGTWQALGAGGVTLVDGESMRRFAAGSRIEGLQRPRTGRSDGEERR